MDVKQDEYDRHQNGGGKGKDGLFPSSTFPIDGGYWLHAYTVHMKGEELRFINADDTRWSAQVKRKNERTYSSSWRTWSRPTRWPRACLADPPQTMAELLASVQLVDGQQEYDIAL